MTLPAAGAPQLSLLCCTVGRTEKLTRLLASLAEQTRKDFELVIVDQNPPGELDPILAPWRDKLDIRHIRSARGLSRARNVGLAACNAPLVAFPDDDCWWPPQLAERLIKLFADHPDIGLIAGRTQDAGGQDSLGLFLNVDAEIDLANIWRTGNSNSIFARTQAARAINGFDEALGVGADSPFKSGEETDFVLRLLGDGVRGEYIADLVVHHDQAPQGGAAGVARAQGYAQGYGRVLRRHRFGGLFVLTRIARSSARAALNLAQGDLDGARYKALWALGTIKGYCAR